MNTIKFSMALFDRGVQDLVRMHNYLAAGGSEYAIYQLFDTKLYFPDGIIPGEEGFVDAIKRAWRWLVEKLKAIIAAIKRFFGFGSDDSSTESESEHETRGLGYTSSSSEHETRGLGYTSSSSEHETRGLGYTSSPSSNQRTNDRSTNSNSSSSLGIGYNSTRSSSQTQTEQDSDTNSPQDMKLLGNIRADGVDKSKLNEFLSFKTEYDTFTTLLEDVQKNLMQIIKIVKRKPTVDVFAMFNSQGITKFPTSALNLTKKYVPTLDDKSYGALSKSLTLDDFTQDSFQTSFNQCYQAFKECFLAVSGSRSTIENKINIVADRVSYADTNRGKSVIDAAYLQKTSDEMKSLSNVILGYIAFYKSKLVYELQKFCQDFSDKVRSIASNIS